MEIGLRLEEGRTVNVRRYAAILHQPIALAEVGSRPMRLLHLLMFVRLWPCDRLHRAMPIDFPVVLIFSEIPPIRLENR